MMESSAAVDQSNIAACESQLADITIQSQKMSNDSAGIRNPSSLDECGAAALTTEGDARESQPHSDTNQDAQVQEIKTSNPDVPGQQSELGSLTDMAEEAITNPQNVSSSPVQCSESEPLSSYPPAEGTCGPVASQEDLTALPPPSSLCDWQTLETEVLQRLTFSPAVFKSQQRGDPDLTCQQKIAIARDLLHNKPPAFFSRFGRHMVEEDLPFLRQLSGEYKYMVDFCIKEIENKCDSKKNSVRVKNRRYEAMKQLQSGGEYFSDEQIKARDPLLYEQMVGQYLTGEDAEAAIDRSDLRLSNILVKHMDIIQNNTIYNIQKEYEESQMEESDEEEEEEDMQWEEKEEECPTEISEIEKKMLRAELVRTMQERFIQGQDKDFDYSSVDNNVEYDSIDIREQDEQERYFDDDDSDEKYFEDD